MVLMVLDIQSLSADIPLTSRVCLVRTDLNQPIVLNQNLKATEIYTQYTGSLFPFLHGLLL